MGQGNKKLSKRDPESNLLGYRERGFLPEGLLNYLALLGWAIAEDRDIFSMQEMVEAFRLDRVNPNPARFDLKKAEAINATHLRALSLDDLTERMLPYLQSADLLPAEEVTAEDRELLRRAAPLVHERMTTLAEAVDMLGFLFVDEDSFTRDPADAEKLLSQDGRTVAKAAYDALTDVTTWDTTSIEEALRAALVEGLGLKPRNAFGPVRVAITGRRGGPLGGGPGPQARKSLGPGGGGDRGGGGPPPVFGFYEPAGGGGAVAAPKRGGDSPEPSPSSPAPPVSPAPPMLPTFPHAQPQP